MLINASGRLLVSTDPTFALYERIEDQTIIGPPRRVGSQIMLMKNDAADSGLSVWTVHSLDLVVSLILAELIIGSLVFCSVRISLINQPCHSPQAALKMG